VTPEYRGDYYNAWPSAVHGWAAEFEKEADLDREAFFLIGDA
jgi:hypothetical protein